MNKISPYSWWPYCLEKSKAKSHLACEQALLFQASEASLSRMLERGAEERRACNHPLQIFIATPETPGLRKA